MDSNEARQTFGDTVTRPMDGRTYWRDSGGCVSCDIHATGQLAAAIAETAEAPPLHDDLAAVIGWTRISSQAVAEFGRLVRGEDGLPLPPCDTCRG